MSKPTPKAHLKQSDNGTANAIFIALPLLIISLLYSTKAVDAVLLPKFIAFAVFAIVISALALKNAAAFSEVKKHLFFILILSLYFSQTNFLDAGRQARKASTG